MIGVLIPIIDLEYYNKKELIGSGSFVKVYIFQNKETGAIYAAKNIKEKLSGNKSNYLVLQTQFLRFAYC